MLRLYACIVDQHDLRLVALAAAVCVLSCYTAVDLLARARHGDARYRPAWSAAAAAIFGAGVWATHFLAELAYDPGLPLGYEIRLTALSLVAAMALAWLGIAAALKGDMPWLGGGVVGLAVGAMHYIGMAALRLPAVVRWDAPYVLASLAIGITLGAAALGVARQAATLRRRLLSTGLLVGAIVGLHFVGMTALTLEPDPRIPLAGDLVRSEPLIAAVILVTALIVALAVVGLVADSRMTRLAARDAERLRDSEARLRQSERHLARAQELAEIGSFEIGFDGKMVWSDNLYRIHGVDKERFVPTFDAVLPLLHPDDRAAFIAARERIRAGDRQQAGAFRIIRPTDGACRHLWRESEPIYGEDGSVIGVFGMVRDITAATELEEQRRALEAQLQHSQRLEALGTLAGGVAHDLNNTLVPILSLAKLTMRRLPEASRERANLATILKAGERARDLVAQILAFSRKETPARQAVDVAALLRDSLRMLASSLPATIRLHCVIEDVPLVSADPGQLHQVMLNLVVNAAQAIGDKMGRIGVTLGSTHAPLPGESRGERVAPAVHFAVEDTGCGMDEATRQRIFEPFFTTKPVGVGTGLGLSVVHGIIGQHGGRITVESRPGEGTRFDVYLPALSGEEEAQQLEQAALAI